MLALFLLFSYFFSAILPQEDLQELAKITDLIAHYQEHSEENPDISLIEFWNLHYGKDATNHHTQDTGCHNKLPFKNHHHTDITFVTANIDLPHFSLPINLRFQGKKYLFPIYNDIESNARLSDIWQPPKLG